VKIRNGFVSNSSTSSFIVRVYDWIKEKELISEKYIKLLKKYGFRKTNIYVPSSYDNEEWEIIKDGHNYGYFIDCNQHEPLKFLLKHKIPFSSSIHYNSFNVYYDGKDKVVLGNNFGENFSGFELLDNFIKQGKRDCKFEIFTVKEFKKYYRVK
jgi:hypothetical protein